MPDQKNIIISIVTYNRLELTRQCIDNLIKHTHQYYSLIVADNNSQDGTKEYLKDLYKNKSIHHLMLFDKNFGVAPAANSIWEKYPDCVYIKLDNDIKIENHHWLEDMLEVIETNQQELFVAYSFLTQLKKITYPIVQLPSSHQVQLPEANMGGACICIPPKVHEKLGFWCEDYSPYGEEDTDFCFRARLMNIPFYYMKDTSDITHLYCKKSEVHDAGLYRQFKNTHRERNISEKGFFSRNLSLYQNNIRPLKLPRKFKTIQLDEFNYSLELNREYSQKISDYLKILDLLSNR